jgi:hypothetical protein|tara:strand:- start:130 stop:339 length:210 start_codon:yes stop_codon:yes gene_type:complete
MTEAQVLQALLYSGILLYIGYSMGKRDNVKIVADTIDTLMNKGFLKWYWKDGQKEILKWRDEVPEELND